MDRAPLAPPVHRIRCVGDRRRRGRGRVRRSWPPTVGPWPSARAAESRGGHQRRGTTLPTTRASSRPSCCASAGAVTSSSLMARHSVFRRSWRTLMRRRGPIPARVCSMGGLGHWNSLLLSVGVLISTTPVFPAASPRPRAAPQAGECVRRVHRGLVQAVGPPPNAATPRGASQRLARHFAECGRPSDTDGSLLAKWGRAALRPSTEGGRPSSGGTSRSLRRF